MRSSFWMMTFMLLAQSLAWGEASKVLKIGRDQINVAVTHEEGRKPWRENDAVCIHQGGKSVVCGTVIRTSPKGAIVRLEKATTEIAAGNEVHARPGVARTKTAAANKSKKRRPASSLTGSASLADSKASTFNLSAGLNAGLSYFYPSLDFQIRLSKNVALGLAPMYLKATADTTTLSAVGGFGTLNYYFDGNFRGLWAQAGGGYIMFSTSDTALGTSESIGVMAGIGTLGWRGYWDFGLNIGVAAGVQYIKAPQFTDTEVKSAGVQPIFLLDAGVGF